MNVSEAIDHLTARGFHAQNWESPATPGAIAVSSGFVDVGDGIQILRHTVFVKPAGLKWKVSCEMPATSEHNSLAEAVEVAAKLVAELKKGGIPNEWLSTATLI